MQYLYVYECKKPPCGSSGIAEFPPTPAVGDLGSVWVPCPDCGEPMNRVSRASFEDVRNLPKLTTYGRHGPVFFVSAQHELPEGFSNQFKKLSDRRSRKKYLTEDDVAEALGISVKAVKKLVREKRLKSVRLTGRKRLFTWELIDDFIRRESGVNVDTPRDSQAPSLKLPQASRRPIPINESRKLLKAIREKGGQDIERR